MFYVQILYFLAILIIAVPMSVMYNYWRSALALKWREALTRQLVDKYYANRTFYVLETTREIDNPDQRIAEDVSEFTSTSLEFFFMLFSSITNLFSFSIVLYQISPLLFFALIVYALFGSYVTAWLGKTLVGLYYRQLQKEADFRFGLIRTREYAESIAFYDSTATQEKTNIWNLFQNIVTNKMSIIRTQRKLQTFTTAYEYIVYVIPYLVVAPLYLNGLTDLGAITQSSEAFYNVKSDLSIIIDYFEDISLFSAGLNRLNTFMQRIEVGGWDLPNDLQDDQYDNVIHKSKDDFDLEAFQNDKNSSNTIHTFATTVKTRVDSKINIMNISPLSLVADSDGYADHFSSVNIVLQCKNLTVMTPDSSRVLIGDVNRQGSLSSNETGVDFSIMKNDRLLIVGPSGCGKSSLIRVIAGLWEMGSGDVLWNADMMLSEEDIHTKSTDSYEFSDNGVKKLPSSILFLPQKPYNVVGTLRQQISYPSIVDDSDDWSIQEDSYLLDILEKVKLGDLALRVGNGNERKGLNATKDWSKVLSLGEQQRLAFARILYNKPSVVALDEATSALDKDAEESVYNLLIETNTTYISVGHNPSLLRFHQKKLVLYGPTHNLKIENIPHISATNTSKLF